MDIQYELRYLGFTPNEVKVYLTLLRIGRTKAGRLARECRLERTSVYNALRNLIDYGIVSYVIESSRRIFFAAEPDKIFDFLKEKQERASLLIDEIKKIKKFELEKENILKFRGYSGVKTVLNDALKYDKWCTFGSEKQLSDRMPTFAKIFVARKDARKIRSRILIREGLEGHKQSKYSKIRYVPKQVMSPAVTTVYSNKVSIILWSETPEAIIIDNKETADSFRSYFEFMWQHAKKTPH